VFYNQRNKDETKDIPMEEYDSKSLLNLIIMSGLRKPLIERNKNKRNYRRDVPMNHGFRKFFHTTCVNAGMGYTYSEFIMGHKLPGVKSDYFKPQPDENGIYRDILEGNDKNPGYLSAIDALTINDENRLRRQVHMLKVEKSEIDQLREEVEEYRQMKPCILDLKLEIDKMKSMIGL
jgi:hypothetical protein